MKPKTTDHIIQTKTVKHTYSPEERNCIGDNLARAIGGLRGIEAEFDQVKASFKAKLTEAEAKIDSLSTNLVNGFDMRNESCVVVFRPKERKKHFYLESSLSDLPMDGLEPVLIEDMTREDFQAELIQAEAKFEHRIELQLFAPTENDRGVLVVGRLAGKWFSALRVRIGKLVLEERLDAEQKCCKERRDAIAIAIKRAKAWSKEHLKDLAKGFEAGFDELAKSQAEIAE